MKVSVVVCTKNRYNSFIECIRSLRKQTVKPFEIIIVDASISNSTKNYIKEKHFYIYLRQKNKGLSYARNLAVKKVRGDVVLFLDDDVILEKDYLKYIVKTYSMDREGIVGGVEGFIENRKKLPFVCKIIDYFFVLDSPIKGVVLPSGRNTYPATLKGHEIRRVYWLSGCNMSYRREVFNCYKFDENFGAVGGKYCPVGEDLDFSYRVSKKYVLLMNPHAKVKHLFLRSQRKLTLNFDIIRNFQSRTIKRYNFFKKNKKFFLQGIFWWSEVGQLVSAGVKYLLEI